MKMTFDDNEIHTAYRKLKRLVYYDKTDLKLRQRLAEFECDIEFDEKLSLVETVVNSSDPSSHKVFKRWLKEIGFRAVPKQIGQSSSDLKSNGESGKFISNVTSTKIVDVTKVNYFFDGPIELHLIAVLWIMREGRLLDAQLGSECCGSRLVPQLHNPNDRSADLFRKYHEQYARWRDTGIRKAKQMLTEERTSVGILGLDIQEFFYCIRLDVPTISNAISEARQRLEEVSSAPFPSKLSDCLQSIHVAYRAAIDPFLQITHPQLSKDDTGIPIGLCSSLVLANWYLKGFDDAVKRSLRPAYYGRYVDDILLVVPSHEDPSQMGETPVEKFIEAVLVTNGILLPLKENKNQYEIAQPRALFLQKSKCILQFFDAKHSIAGLEKFQKKLEENGSDFLLMPVDEADNSLEDVAYELLYEGSINKFRSVKGMAENRYELAKHLARQTILHLLTDDPPDPKVSAGLLRFFKGKSAIEYYDLWERVFTFFLIANDSKASKLFEKHLIAEIKRVRFRSEPEVSKRLAADLVSHLERSLGMACSLGNGDFIFPNSEAHRLSAFFRLSNMMRHHFIRKPLLNFTNFEGPLTARAVKKRVKPEPRMLELSPRYVNFDECLLLAKSGDVNLNRQPPFTWAQSLYETINRHSVVGVKWESISEEQETSDD